MKLFKLIKDENYKFYTADNIISYLDNREKNTESDIEIKLTLFEGKSKKDCSKRNDFNISVVSPFIFVNDELKQILENFAINVDFVPTVTNNGTLFYYLVANHIVDILDFQNKAELTKMAITNQFKYKEMDLDDIYIFRDVHFSSLLIVTEQFKDKFIDKLKGAIFEEL